MLTCVFAVVAVVISHLSFSTLQALVAQVDHGGIVGAVNDPWVPASQAQK